MTQKNSRSRIALDIKDQIAFVRLNRADKLNALDMPMFEAIVKVTKQLKKNKDIRAIILSGEGAAFCSGLDVKSMFKNPLAAVKLLVKPGARVSNLAQDVSFLWREIPVPVIAVTHGKCWGGGFQIALGADFRYSTPDCEFSIMESRWGLIPDMGGTITLRELASIDIIKELAMTAKIFKGEEAKQYGLVTHIFDDPMTEAIKFAELAVDKYPDSPKALRYYFAAKSDEQSLEKIQQAYKKNSDNIELGLLYVDALINSDDLAQALIVSNAINTSVKTPKKAWLQRIAIYRRQGNSLQVLTTIEKWIQANPYHIEPILMISDHYVKQRQADKALQYINKGLSEHHKDNLPLKIVKIQLLLDTGKLYEARKFFEDKQFEVIRPELKSGLEGRIALLDKNFDEATKKLPAFYSAFPTPTN